MKLEVVKKVKPFEPGDKMCKLSTTTLKKKLRKSKAKSIDFIC